MGFREEGARLGEAEGFREEVEGFREEVEGFREEVEGFREEAEVEAEEGAGVGARLGEAEEGVVEASRY